MTQSDINATIFIAVLALLVAVVVIVLIIITSIAIGLFIGALIIYAICKWINAIIRFYL